MVERGTKLVYRNLLVESLRAEPNRLSRTLWNARNIEFTIDKPAASSNLYQDNRIQLIKSYQISYPPVQSTKCIILPKEEWLEGNFLLAMMLSMLHSPCASSLWKYLVITPI